MCSSHGFNGNCCPSAQIFQEEICGNLTGPLASFIVWRPVGVDDYIQGTFEIFNAGPGTITATVSGNPGQGLNVPPGASHSIAINNPTAFSVTVPAGTTGKWCITLYKRLFA